MTPGLLAEWSLWMRAAGMSPRTINDRVSLVQRFEIAVEAHSLDVQWVAIAEFIGGFVTAGTRQTYYAHLCSWFHWLVLMDYRVDDPTAKLRAPKGPKRKPRPISLDQLGTILDTAMHHRTRVMVLLGAYQGLRVSEIAQVRGSDLRGGTIRGVGKGDKPFELPLHELVEQIAATMPLHGFWFPSHVNFGCIRGKSVSAMISKLMDRAGVNGTPHALRHFFGTECLRVTGNLELTRRLMRHESVATTAMYTEVDDSELRATIAALPVPGRQNARKPPASDDGDGRLLLAAGVPELRALPGSAGTARAG